MKKQMSESLMLISFLTLAGGFQDAYSYNMRSHVFANAQTGNVVLFAQNLATGKYNESVHYLYPILAFVLGVYFSEKLRRHNEKWFSLHWRQLVLLIEVFLLIVVGFLSSNYDDLANMMMSFACAMQVNAFRKMNGLALATTMCIGNMRTGTEYLAKYSDTKDKKLLWNSLSYYFIILIFGIGAAFGFIMSQMMQLQAIWVAAGLMFVGFALMFRDGGRNDVDNTINNK